MPILPRLEKSRFGDGTGLNVMACERDGARAAKITRLGPRTGPRLWLWRADGLRRWKGNRITINRHQISGWCVWPLNPYRIPAQGSQMPWSSELNLSVHASQDQVRAISRGEESRFLKRSRAGVCESRRPPERYRLTKNPKMREIRFSVVLECGRGRE